MAARSSKPATEPGAAEGSTGPAVATLQEAADKAVEQGFRGVEVDPTPNAHYAVGGVLQGLPTPETDKQAAAEARTASEAR